MKTMNGTPKGKTTTKTSMMPATQARVGLEKYARTPDEALYARALAAGADVVFVGDPLGGEVYTPETFTSRKRRRPTAARA